MGLIVRKAYTQRRGAENAEGTEENLIGVSIVLLMDGWRKKAVLAEPIMKNHTSVLLVFALSLRSLCSLRLCVGFSYA